MKKVLVVGDSNTWGYDPRGYLQKYDYSYVDYLNDLVPDYKFFVDAQNGRLLRDVIHETWNLENLDLVYVMLGSNDLMHYYDTNQIVSFMKTLLNPMEKEKVLILCPPVLKIDSFETESKALNAAYKQLGYLYVDANPLPMSFDGVHLSQEGHKMLANKIYEHIKKIQA